MAGTLVVVESPAKAKTIEKYLGGDYAVRASFGHVRDLPKSQLGVDVDDGFTVTYEVPDDSKKHVAEMKRDAIIDAVQHPRAIDLELFDAQEARRVLDRLVGYRISPILWRRVRPGLSAGRVQSVAVRLIVEREREIRAFRPVEYWSVDVRLTPEGEEQPFVARLTEIPEGKLATAPDKKGILLGAETDAMPHVERLRRV